MKKATNLKIASPLNKLGKKLNSKQRTAADTDFICTNLSKFIVETLPPIPRGKLHKDYRLSQAPDSKRFHPKSKERLLEAKLFEKFTAGGPKFLPGINQIVAFQVPLYSAASKDGWGSIDLLGKDEDGYPVVIELKIAKKSVEAPLRAVVEAVAYMIALRENWSDFISEWGDRTQSCDLAKPKRLTAVVLAPQEYWAKIKDDDYFREALPHLDVLVAKLGTFGFRVRFASINAKLDGQWKLSGSAEDILCPLAEHFA